MAVERWLADVMSEGVLDKNREAMSLDAFCDGSNAGIVQAGNDAGSYETIDMLYGHI